MLTTAYAFMLLVTQLLREHPVPLGSVSERTERSSKVFQYLDLPAVREDRAEYIHSVMGKKRGCSGLQGQAMCHTEGAEPLLPLRSGDAQEGGSA